VQVGPIAGSNQLFFVGGASLTKSSLLSFVGGPALIDTVPVNNPQSPDTVANPLVYTITGINATYDATKQTAFDLMIDAGINPGEAAQVQVFYDLTGSGTYNRTELYHYFGTDPVLGYEDYNATARGGLQTATGTLGNMTNGTVVVKVWEALPGPNNGTMALSVGTNVNSLSSITIPFKSVTQSPAGPAAVTGAMATAKSSSQIDLMWAASTTNGVTYNVYRGTVSGFMPGTANLIKNVSATTYSDTGLTANTTYFYVVASTSTAGTSAGTQVSAKTLAIPTTATLAISAQAIFLNGTETLTATIAPSAATGTVTFLDGSATLGTGAVTGGVASFKTAALSGGTHSFTAAYSGDSTYGASTSAAVTLNVPLVAPDFTIVFPAATALVGAGQTANYSFNLTPVGGFNNVVTFGCSGLPSLTTCSFSPATATLNGTMAQTVTLKIATTGTSAALAVPVKPTNANRQPLYTALAAIGLGIIFLGGNRRRILRGVVLSCAMLAILGMVTACSKAAIQTPTGITTVTVSATSGATTHTTTVTLDVQQY
jgi:hypothetical protein